MLCYLTLKFDIHFVRLLETLQKCELWLCIDVKCEKKSLLQCMSSHRNCNPSTPLTHKTICSTAVLKLIELYNILITLITIQEKL